MESGEKRERKGGNIFPHTSDRSSESCELPPASEKSFHDEGDVPLGLHSIMDNWVAKYIQVRKDGNLEYEDNMFAFFLENEVVIEWKDCTESPDVKDKCIEYLQSLLALLRFSF